MMEHKRSPLSIDQSSLNTFSLKRHKADLSISSKERKEKLSERIVALQQLVSPYGKTDTGSVLLEAMEYIRFLHEQAKVLSAPYLQSTPTPKMQETGPHSLRSKGLCLVPISCTTGVASSNGADIWAPIKTTSPKFAIGIGKSKSGPVYRLCMVQNVDVADRDRQYKLENKTTYKYLNVVWGNESSAARWQMAMVSDSPPLKNEFDQWVREVERSGVY
ncbi:Transcription factor bHLH153 [Camellia lanceoleosa]|nr:Transcription factor bHLH153 [Camellia lanceoleosa]